MAKDNKKLHMSFDPLVIDDLGAKLYSTLPPVLAELVANGYDACAKEVFIDLNDNKETGKEIIVSDGGIGMSFDEINEKYLRIGRKRRDYPEKNKKCKRQPIGKKGLGKLAFFGISTKAEIETVQDNKKTVFTMDWDEIQHVPDQKEYEPNYSISDTKEKSYTKITLKNIKRKTDFDVDKLKKSISNYFIFDKDFKVFIKTVQENDYSEINNELRYTFSDRQEEFFWNFPDFLKTYPEIEQKYTFTKNLTGKIITFNKPVPNNIRGVTLFSRKKLVSTPETFPVYSSSHFYQYLTGWLEVDFIDELKPDVIATNRSSLNWNDEKLEELNSFLYDVIKIIEKEWRDKKADKRKDDLKKEYNIDFGNWQKTNENNSIISENIESLSKILADPEKAEGEDLDKIVKIIYNLAPEHANFVLWQGLNKKITENFTIKKNFFKQKYLEAAQEAVKIYNEEVQSVSGRNDICDKDLMAQVFGAEVNKPIALTAKSNDNEKNLDEGHKFLSMGVMIGFKNPAGSHTSITKLLKDGTFTDRNCLDILSTVSYLFNRLERRESPRI